MPSNSKRPAPIPANLAKQSSTSSSTDIASHPSGSTASDHGSANNTAPKGGAVRASQTGQTGGLPSKDDSTAPVPTSAPSVNRKKQKRREKAAARLAAEQQAKGGYSSATNAMGQNGPASAFAHQPHIDEHVTSLNGDEVREGDEAYYTDDDDDQVYAQPPMESQANVGTRKSRKKKGKKNRSTSHNLTEDSLTSLSTPSSSAIRPPPPPPPLSSAALRSAHKISKDRIWNTSTQEERENIKEFWLQLGEEERRSLVKVEKEAVLRKMKEQQKHSCSCTVCGRKRTAIEEELEVLYDAYYEELEQYANHNQGSFENGAPIVPPPRLYRSQLHTLERHTHPPHTHHPPGMVQELPEDEEEDLEDDYDEDDEDDEVYSDDEFDPANSTRADFFAFGNSLTVKDGILTVADDLLKNDGKHFIDMMEQLAERRMQREEDTQYAAASAAHQSMHANHNHGPPLDEEDYDDEEEEDYDSQEDEEYEEDEMDAMTEEQRMAEGRRMFQIFAARMFEQRVLTAYREKVARERQQKLIEELEEESRQDVQREAKKAREAQKRKDKKRLQKQAKEEEKAKREAEKAAEAAAAKALEERRLEEQRKKKEEQRKKKEAERKAQEEERLRKEAEKQKRLQEERERQAEQERKQRENKEREKKRREEAKKKEREQREAKEKELADKKAKEEQERKAREAETKRQKEPARAERENNERARRDEHAGQPVPQATKRMSQSGSNYLPPGLQHPHGAIQSPHFQVATPVVPKAPTPVRARQASQQGSHASSPRSQPAGTDASQMSVSPGNGASQSSGTSSVVSGKGLGQAPILQHPQPSAPMSPLGGAGRVSHAQNFMPALNGIPPSTSGLSGMMPRMPLGHEAPLYSNHPGTLGSQFRGFTSPEGMPMPPGINGVRQGVPGRGFPLDTGHGLPFHPQPHMQAPMSSQQPPVSRETGPQGHTRQPSSSYERSPLEAQGHNPPISRPAPIQRPPSTAPHDSAKQENRLRQSEIDELSTQLGSSALLDDTDIPLTSGPSQPIPTAAPPGAPGSGRLGFGTSPIFSGSLESSKHASFSPLGGATAGNTWGSPVGFPTPGFPGAPTWGPASGTGWSNSAFGVIGGSHRLHQSRPVTIRLLVCQACTRLNANQEPTHHNVNQVLQQVHQQSHTLNPPLEPQISLDEMLDICETEGNSQNGGGSFSIKDDGAGGALVKFDPGLSSTAAGPRGSIAPGDIGSPIPGSSMPVVGGIGTSANSRQFPPTNLSPQTEF